MVFSTRAVRGTVQKGLSGSTLPIFLGTWLGVRNDFQSTDPPFTVSFLINSLSRSRASSLSAFTATYLRCDLLDSAGALISEILYVCG